MLSPCSASAARMRAAVSSSTASSGASARRRANSSSSTDCGVSRRAKRAWICRGGKVSMISCSRSRSLTILSIERKLLAAQNLAVRLTLRDLLVGVLGLRGQAVADPVLHTVRQLQLGQIRGLAPLVHGGLHRLAQLHHKLRLTRHHFRAARHAVARQHGLHLQLFGRAHNFRPVADVAVGRVVVWTVHHRIACAQDLLFGQVDEAVAAGVRPAEEMELHLARAVVQDEQVVVEGLLGRLDAGAVHGGYVPTLVCGLLPAGRLVTDGSMLAITAANGITFLSASTFEKIHRLNDSFESCRFDAKNRLWTWARFSTATVIVEVWEPGTW